MIKYAITHGKVYTPYEQKADTVILIEKGKITYVGEVQDLNLEEYEEIDASGMIISPGLVDLQVNGAGGYLYNQTENEEQLEAISKANARTGTTSILATVITDPLEKLQGILKRISKFKEKGGYEGTEVLGIHLEGPYLNPAKKGGHSGDYLAEPNISHFQKIEEATEGNLKIVSLAPELSGANELIKYISDNGIRCSLAHTNASLEDVIKATENGLDMGTHLFNAMDGMGSRQPGTVGAILALDNISTGIICDGKHVHPMSIKAAMKAKGLDKVFMVTDAVSPLGTSLKSFKLYGVDVVIKNGGCYTPEGILAGSATPLLKCVQNVVNFVGFSLEDALTMATINPAREIGLDSSKGSIEVGKDADIIICDENISLEKVMIKGEIFTE